MAVYRKPGQRSRPAPRPWRIARLPRAAHWRSSRNRRIPACPRRKPMSSSWAPASSASRAALHLQAQGRAVTLVDRLGAAAGETSFGNSGIVAERGGLPLHVSARARRDRRSPRSISIRACKFATAPCRRSRRGCGAIFSPPRRRRGWPRAWRCAGSSCAASPNIARSPSPRARARCCARAAGSRCSAPRAARTSRLPNAEETKPYGVAERVS